MLTLRKVVSRGNLKVLFDSNHKIETMDFETASNEEYLPRNKVVDAARPLHEWQKEWRQVNAPADGKQSPEISKKGKAKPLKSPPNPPPEIDIPETKVKANMGITPNVFRFLEVCCVHHLHGTPHLHRIGRGNYGTAQSLVPILS